MSCMGEGSETRTAEAEGGEDDAKEKGGGNDQMERVTGEAATKTRHQRKQRTETTSFINEGIRES